MTQLKNYEQNTNLIDCVKLGIIIVDEQGLVVRGNQIACQLLNVEKNEWSIFRTFHSLIKS